MTPAYHTSFRAHTGCCAPMLCLLHQELFPHLEDPITDDLDINEAGHISSIGVTWDWVERLKRAKKQSLRDKLELQEERYERDRIRWERDYRKMQMEINAIRKKFVKMKWALRQERRARAGVENKFEQRSRDARNAIRQARSQKEDIEKLEAAITGALESMFADAFESEYHLHELKDGFTLGCDGCEHILLALLSPLGQLRSNPGWIIELEDEPSKIRQHSEYLCNMIGSAIYSEDNVCSWVRKEHTHERDYSPFMPQCTTCLNGLRSVIQRAAVADELAVEREKLESEVARVSLECREQLILVEILREEREAHEESQGSLLQALGELQELKEEHEVLREDLEEARESTTRLRNIFVAEMNDAITTTQRLRARLAGHERVLEEADRTVALHQEETAKYKYFARERLKIAQMALRWYVDTTNENTPATGSTSSADEADSRLIPNSNSTGANHVSFLSHAIHAERRISALMNSKSALHAQLSEAHGDVAEREDRLAAMDIKLEETESNFLREEMSDNLPQSEIVELKETLATLQAQYNITHERYTKLKVFVQQQGPEAAGEVIQQQEQEIEDLRAKARRTAELENVLEVNSRCIRDLEGRIEQVRVDKEEMAAKYRAVEEENHRLNADVNRITFVDSYPRTASELILPCAGIRDV